MIATASATYQPADRTALSTKINACITNTGDWDDNDDTCADVENWDVSNVTSMYQMFANKANFNEDISRWDISSVTTLEYMFSYAAKFNQSIGAWDVSRVTTMSSLFFQWDSDFDQDISAWDVSSVTNMNNMFYGCRDFNQDISGWDMSSVVGTGSMFKYCDSFNQNISGWDMSSAIYMQSMFGGAKAFNQDISAWDVVKVTNMVYMFQSAEDFDQVLCGQSWIDSNASQTDMFQNAGSNAKIATEACSEDDACSSDPCGEGTCTLDGDSYNCTYTLADVTETLEVIFDDTASFDNAGQKYVFACSKNGDGDETLYVTPSSEGYSLARGSTFCGTKSSTDTTCGTCRKGFRRDYIAFDKETGKSCSGKYDGSKVMVVGVTNVLESSATNYYTYRTLDFNNGEYVINVKDQTGGGEHKWYVYYFISAHDLTSTEECDVEVSITTGTDAGSCYNNPCGTGNCTEDGIDYTCACGEGAANDGTTCVTCDTAKGEVVQNNQCVFAPDEAKDMYETLFGFTVDTNTEMSVCVCRKHDDTGDGSLDLVAPSSGYSSNTGTTDPCPAADTCKTGYTKDHLYLTFNDITCDSTTYTKTSTGIGLNGNGDNGMEFFEITFEKGGKITVVKADSHTGDVNWGRFMTYDIHSVSSTDQCAFDLDVVKSATGNVTTSIGLVEMATNMGTVFADDSTVFDDETQQHLYACRRYEDDARFDDITYTPLKGGTSPTKKTLFLTEPTDGYELASSKGTTDASDCGSGTEPWWFLIDLRSTTGTCTNSGKMIAAFTDDQRNENSNVYPRYFNVDINNGDYVFSFDAFDGEYGSNIAEKQARTGPGFSSHSGPDWQFTRGMDGGCGESSSLSMIRYATPAVFEAEAEVVYQPADKATLKAKVDACISDTGNWDNTVEHCDTVANWDTSLVTDMFGIFQNKANFNEDISAWNVSQATNMGSMFNNAGSFNQDISGWDVSKNTAFGGMFWGASVFNQDISSWDVSSGTSFNNMFWNAAAFNQDISSWVVSNGQYFYNMFRSTNVFNQDISSWDVSKTTALNHMFFDAKAFNQDISGWDVSGVTKMDKMFGSAIAFNQDLSDWDVSSVTTFDYMFGGASAFDQELCGQTWLDTTADDNVETDSMFSNAGSNAKIATAACVTEAATTAAAVADDACTNNPCGDGKCTVDGESYTCKCKFGFVNDGTTCTACAAGQVVKNNVCTTPSNFKASVVASLPKTATKKQKRKAWRDVMKPVPIAGKTKRENMARLPVTKEDLSEPQKKMMEKFKGRTPVITVATEQTESSTDIADCHYDIEQESEDEKEVLMPYGEGNYAFMCSGTTFVARQKETAEGTMIACWEDTDWGTEALIAESTICNDVSIEIGSVSTSCTATLPDCCDDCGVCDTDPTNDNLCDSQCYNASSDRATYQALGCCGC